MHAESYTIPHWNAPDGRPIRFYRMTNRNGASVEFCDWGARWTQALVPDASGRFSDVLQGYDTWQELVQDPFYRGATIGRYANRIANAEVEVDGIRYALDRNDGRNSNHGGQNGLNTCLWKGKLRPDGVTFTLHSPHLSGGWPGNLSIAVTYRWSDDQTLYITYTASTDRTTWLNLTNHAYFNLGSDPASILDHTLYIPSGHRLDTDVAYLPTGRLLSTRNSPFDFTVPRPIGSYRSSDDPQFVWNRGYNHCFRIPDPEQSAGVCHGLPLAARLTAPDTGRVVCVGTDYPGILVYSGGFLPRPASAIALEAQYWPDSPSHPDFPSCCLHAGETYHHHICFAFSAKAETAESTGTY